MKNNLIELVPISLQDINCFDGTEYEHLTIEKRIELIKNSENGCYNGQFFKFFLLKGDDELIGFMNVCARSKSVISIAPEIKKRYRRKGYGEKGVFLALTKAEKLGYKIAMATVIEENIASIKLHEKLGFIHIGNKVSKNGNLLKIYSRKV